MKLENLKPNWGLIVRDTNIDQVLDLGPDFWRKHAYEKDLILFRGLGDIGKENFYRLMSYFGRPLNDKEYFDNGEATIKFTINGVSCCFGHFNNLNSYGRLGGSSLPWHVDHSHHGDRSFPWRSLYIRKNPNPENGLTGFINLRLDNIRPTDQELDYYKRLEVLNVGWYKVGDNPVKNSYIKVHPLSGKMSLRSNHFRVNTPAYIDKTYLDGVEVDNLETLGPIHKKLSEREDLTYYHRWQDYDLLIYDNYHFMHNRTDLRLSAGQIREFFRANVAHLSDQEWIDHKNFIKELF